jgi:hypothetical protein
MTTIIKLLLLQNNNNGNNVVDPKMVMTRDNDRSQRLLKSPKQVLHEC